MSDITHQACAIVVTYHPDLTALLKLLGQLNKETDFIIVDNGSPEIDELADSILVYERCKRLISLARNEGLARGLNIGIEWARRADYEFVFLFDQDSSLCDLYAQRMLSAWQEVNSVSKQGVAALGPRIINPQTMRQTPFKVFDRMFGRSDRRFASQSGFFEADFLITSGSLIPMQCLDSIGAMKESLFIDNVDLEWCFRAKSRGYDVVGTDAAVLYHAIGERSENPLVRSGFMAQHNPSRTYYSSRNRVFLYHVDYAPAGWKMRDRIRFFLKASWLLLVSPRRAEYWESVRRGVQDGRTLS